MCYEYLNTERKEKYLKTREVKRRPTEVVGDGKGRRGEGRIPLLIASTKEINLLLNNLT